MIELKHLKTGCLFLYKPNGELFIVDHSGCIVGLTGKSQGDVDASPGANVKVYPVKVTMTYKI